MKKFHLSDFIDPVSVIRILGGIILIILGIIVIALHAMKVVPNNWDSSDFLCILSIIWAYTGPFIGVAISILGLYVLGIIEFFYKWIVKSDWPD